MLFSSRISLIMLFCLLAFGGCSTYVEDLESGFFEPVFPAAEMMSNASEKSGSIFQAGQGGLFSSDRRARRVGDILTVDFNEVFAATKAQTAASAKSDSFDVTLPNVLPNIITGGLGNGEAGNAMAAGTTRSFSGSGNAAQSNSLTGRLSVTIVRVFDNGNMGVLGQKELTLNNGKEYIRLSGIVRPEDISPSNTVSSNLLADAQISYTGAGQLADSSKPGWLSRALRTVSPF
jgi:flagellar L-ring protein precursor FlgH